jgi:hypothetical protein
MMRRRGHASLHGQRYLSMRIKAFTSIVAVTRSCAARVVGGTDEGDARDEGMDSLWEAGGSGSGQVNAPA